MILIMGWRTFSCWEDHRNSSVYVSRARQPCPNRRMSKGLLLQLHLWLRRQCQHHQELLQPNSGGQQRTDTLVPCPKKVRCQLYSTGVVTTAGPGAVLEKAEGRPGRSARGEQVLHPHHPGRGLHRVSLRLQRLQQPGHQHPGGSKQQITSPDFNLALFRIQLSSCLSS